VAREFRAALSGGASQLHAPWMAATTDATDVVSAGARSW
jgi:hypothetical protein